MGKRAAAVFKQAVSPYPPPTGLPRSILSLALVRVIITAGSRWHVPLLCCVCFGVLWCVLRRLVAVDKSIRNCERVSWCGPLTIFRPPPRPPAQAR